MKNMYKIIMLLSSCLIIFGWSACDNDDLDTNQYTGGVSLNVYGPQPVVRGGTLRFLGSNLDQVRQVIIPGVDPITDIEVYQAGIPSEIRVQVPVEGPEEGYVTLVTAAGDSITTITQLTYEETIVFEGFSPASVMPGDIITITGDYLNLITEVIFSEEVTVTEDEFIEHTRYEIQVIVPDAARTGIITLSDATSDDEESTDSSDLANLIYSDEELIVGTPEVTSVTTATRFKAGEIMTITGSYLNLVDYVAFEEDVEVPSVELAEEGEEAFTVSEDATQITLTLPAEAASGTIELVLRSGVTVTATENFEVVVPSGVTVVSSSVKAGSELVLSGSDLDLVTSVSFPTVEDGTMVDGGDFTAGTSELQLTAVPETAVDGNLLLNMANGMNVEVSYTLVKPIVTSYSPATVSAGASLTIIGTDLDLVESVSFGGGSAVVPDEGGTSTSLTVTVPMDSQSGTVVLTLSNGTSVDAGTLTINEAIFCYIASMPEEEVSAGSVCMVEIVNGDKLISVEVDGETVQHMINGSTLLFNVPSTAGSNSVVKLISSNGEVEYEFSFVSDVVVETVIWTGSLELGNWANALQDLAWGGYDFSALEAGDTIVIYFTEDSSSDYWQIKLGRGSDWSILPDFQVYAGGGDAANMEAGATVFSYPLGENDVSEILNNNGLIIQGAYLTITQVAIIY